MFSTTAPYQLEIGSLVVVNHEHPTPIGKTSHLGEVKGGG